MGSHCVKLDSACIKSCLHWDFRYQKLFYNIIYSSFSYFNSYSCIRLLSSFDSFQFACSNFIQKQTCETRHMCLFTVSSLVSNFSAFKLDRSTMEFVFCEPKQHLERKKRRNDFRRVIYCCQF